MHLYLADHKAGLGNGGGINENAMYSLKKLDDPRHQWQPEGFFHTRARCSQLTQFEEGVRISLDMNGHSKSLTTTYIMYQGNLFLLLLKLALISLPSASDDAILASCHFNSKSRRSLDVIVLPDALTFRDISSCKKSQ